MEWILLVFLFALIKEWAGIHWQTWSLIILTEIVIVKIFIDSYHFPHWYITVFYCFILFLILCDLIKLCYILYGTKNMKRVEKFILKRKNEPLFSFVYAQASHDIENQMKIIDDILSNYKQPHIQHYYQVLKAYLKGDYQYALQKANLIQKDYLKNYLTALIYVAMGESKKALQLPLKKEWMKEEILAKIACIEKNEKAFQTHCNNAIECSKGIFRYSLIASFRTLRKEMNSAI